MAVQLQAPVVRTAPSAGLRPWLVSAIMLAVIGVALPIWSYIGWVGDVSALRDRAPELAGLDVVEIDRTWIPVPDEYGTLVSMRVDGGPGWTGEEIAEEARQALVSGGFEESVHYANLRRSLDRPGERFPGYDIATVEPVDGGAIVHLALSTGLKAFLPGWLLVGSYVLALAVIVAPPIARWRESHWQDRGVPPPRRALGWGLLGLTLIQVGLVIRALWISKSRLNGYEAAFGPITNVHDVPNPALGQVRFAVSNVADALYPMGAASILLLVPLLVVGSLVAVDSLRLRNAMLGSWAAATLMTIAWFGSISGHIVNILE